MTSSSVMSSSGLSLTLIVSHMVGVEASSSKLDVELGVPVDVVRPGRLLADVLGDRAWCPRGRASARPRGCRRCAGGRGCGRPAWAPATSCSRGRRPRRRPRSARRPPSPRLPVGQRAVGDLFGQRLPAGQQAVEAVVGEAVGVPQLRLVDRLAAARAGRRGRDRRRDRGRPRAGAARRRRARRAPRASARSRSSASRACQSRSAPERSCTTSTSPDPWTVSATCPLRKCSRPTATSSSLLGSSSNGSRPLADVIRP